MEAAEQVHTIVNKYIKLWSYTNESETYLKAHRAGIHIAQYKDAVDCGLESYINDKIIEIKKIKFSDIIKSDNDELESGVVLNDRFIIQNWVKNLSIIDNKNKN